MGEVHAAAWMKVEGARLAGIVTLDPAARPWLRGFSGRISTDPRDLVLSPDIDVVDICLPTPLHGPWILEAARAGKAVLCEKPFTREAEEAERIADAVSRSGIPFMPAHVARFFPEYRTARDIARSGRIGPIRTARTFRGGAPPSWAPWILDSSQSGGLLVDLLVHDFDYLRWVLGPVRRVHALLASRPHPPGAGSRDVHALVVLRFADGAVAHVEGSWAYPSGSPFRTRLELAGPDGLLVHDSRDAVPITLRTAQSETESRYPLSVLEPDPYVRMIRHFTDCLRTGSPFEVRLDDAVAAVRIATAAAASAAGRRPVEVTP
jgi:UDP-N-acetylglucosamine 3-dehydrogenase